LERCAVAITLCRRLTIVTAPLPETGRRGTDGAATTAFAGKAIVLCAVAAIERHIATAGAAPVPLNCLW
jgi:hypothetical protein